MGKRIGDDHKDVEWVFLGAHVAEAPRRAARPALPDGYYWATMYGEPFAVMCWKDGHRDLWQVLGSAGEAYPSAHFCSISARVEAPPGFLDRNKHDSDDAHLGTLVPMHRGWCRSNGL